jgi:uncharacterized protein YggL (DUF469 family)
MKKRLRKKLLRGEFSHYEAEFTVTLPEGADLEDTFNAIFEASLACDAVILVASYEPTERSLVGVIDFGRAPEAAEVRTRVEAWMAGSALFSNPSLSDTVRAL